MPSYTTEMEKGHFGDGVDHGTANSTEFPLDFGGVLHTEDGALHHQIYEFFQPGPVAQQGGHQLGSSTFQESTFPFTTNYSAAALNLHHLPDETLAISTSAVEHGAPNRRATQFVDHLGSHHILRNQFKSEAADPGYHGLPMTSSSVDDDHQASNLSMFQACGASLKPSNSAHMGTYPSYETSHSLAHLKSRAVGGCEMASLLPRHLLGMKSQKVMAVPDHHASLKPKRSTDQTEHILRERLRRDDMTSKFRMLESLMPPGPKRDRATIVEDSIQYVKNLHHRLKALQQKRSEMKTSSNTMAVKRPTTNAPRHAVTVHHPVTVKKTVKLEINNDNINGTVVPEVSSPSESEDDMIAVAPERASSIDMVEVHLGLPDKIVIEMTCQSHGRIQSQILGALERLQMEVLQCSISKLHGRAMCVISVKPLKVMADSPITSDVVTRALRRAVKVIPE